jgi:ABC-type Fe3+-siderophore transport system permease subunit
MQFDVDARTRRQGRFPHELAMVNLLVFNLMLCAGILAGTMARKGSPLEHYKLWLVSMPLAMSLAVIAYTFRRAARAPSEVPWFAAAHWAITWRRYRVLLVAYLAGAVLVGCGWLLSQASPNLQEVMFVALVRVAVAPMLVAVMVVAVLESSALFQANSGEVPDGIVALLPPPADIARPA